MANECGLTMNFNKLQTVKRPDFDQNILSYLSSENNNQTLATENSRCQKEIKTEMEITPGQYNHEINENPELLEEFHAVMERMKSEETRVTKEIEIADTKPTLIFQSYEENSESSKIILKSINHTSMSLLCRLCASQHKDLVDIVSGNELYQNITEKIEHCLPIVVKEHDDLPKQACRSCLEKVESIHEFYKTVAEAENQLLILCEKITQRFWKVGKLHCESFTECNDEHDSIKYLDNDKQFKRFSEEDANNNKEVQIRDTISGNNSSSSNLIVYGDQNTGSYNNAVSRERTSTFISDTVDNPLQITDMRGEIRIGETMSALEEKKSKSSSRAKKHKVINCRICRAGFMTARECSLHASSHALQYNHPCSICNKTFRVSKDWNDHVLQHEIRRRIGGRIACHECVDCGKKFITVGKLQYHKINHCAGIKTRSCKKCNLIMDSEATLYQHKITVHPYRKELCCDVCGRIFRNSRHLNNHKAKHSGETINEIFSCDDCGKSFLRKAGLIIHLRSHTGERPFVCDFCPKSYKTKAQRTSHLRTHTGEKPFKCLLCGKMFAQASRLSEHANVHSLTKPYKCPVCEKTFKRMNDRKLHMTLHTGEKPYQCDSCNKNFRWPAALRRHKKTLHGLK